MESKIKSSKKESNLKTTHAQDVAAYKAALSAAQTAIETLMADMAVAKIENQHLNMVVRNAHYEIARAAGSQQGQ